MRITRGYRNGGGLGSSARCTAGDDDSSGCRGLRSRLGRTEPHLMLGEKRVTYESKSSVVALLVLLLCVSEPAKHWSPIHTCFCVSVGVLWLVATLRPEIHRSHPTQPGGPLSASYPARRPPWLSVPPPSSNGCGTNNFSSQPRAEQTDGVKSVSRCGPLQ